MNRRKYRPSKKTILREARKCQRDAGYFIDNYCFISHPTEGLIPFKLYDFQGDLLEDFIVRRFVVALKARQLGVSTLIAAYIAQMLLFFSNKEVMIVAIKRETAANILRKIKTILKNLPPWLSELAPIAIDNVNSLALENGSVVKAASSVTDAGRSDALSLLVIDEAAFIDRAGKIWTAASPTLATGGGCIVVSTPNGTDNWFYNLYNDAEEGRNDFYPVRLPWFVHPDRDEEWFVKISNNLPKRDVAQEFLCDFLASGDTFIHSDDIQKIEKTVVTPDYKKGDQSNFWFWDHYHADHQYVLTADVARGDGSDYSTIQILDLTTMRFIGELQTKLKPDEFAGVIDKTGREFGNAVVAVENNTYGHAVLTDLRNVYGYPNIYWTLRGSHEYVDPVDAPYIRNAVMGITASDKTRPIIYGKLEEFIRNNMVVIHSNRLLSEIKTFIWKNRKPQARVGRNDDLVSAAAFACWVAKDADNANLSREEYANSLIGLIMTDEKVLDTSLAGLDRESSRASIPGSELKKMREFGWLLN